MVKFSDTQLPKTLCNGLGGFTSVWQQCTTTAVVGDDGITDADAVVLVLYLYCASCWYFPLKFSQTCPQHLQVTDFVLDQG